MVLGRSPSRQHLVFSINSARERVTAHIVESRIHQRPKKKKKRTAGKIQNKKLLSRERGEGRLLLTLLSLPLLPPSLSVSLRVGGTRGTNVFGSGFLREFLVFTRWCKKQKNPSFPKIQKRFSALALESPTNKRPKRLVCKYVHKQVFPRTARKKRTAGAAGVRRVGSTPRFRTCSRADSARAPKPLEA